MNVVHYLLTFEGVRCQRIALYSAVTMLNLLNYSNHQTYSCFIYTYLFHQVFDEITRLVLSMKKDKLAKNNNSVNVKEPIKLQANSKKKKACNCG